jgi:hypothetical protein
MTAIRIFLFSLCIASSLSPTAARADAGHDHAAPVASGGAGTSVPRVEARSDLFEIVGVVDGGAMKIFLDRYATNEPVPNAKIDIEAGPLKGAAEPKPDGTYAFKHAELTRPGLFPVTFTIVAGGDSDLLVGELVIADPNAATAQANDDPLRKRWWWVAGALFLLAGITTAWWSRRKRVKGTAK